MSKNHNSAVDLGVMQAHVEQTTRDLKAATRAKQRADEAFEAAVAAHENARVQLNAAVQTVKAATTVGNLYAN